MNPCTRRSNGRVTIEIQYFAYHFHKHSLYVRYSSRNQQQSDPNTIRDLFSPISLIPTSVLLANRIAEAPQRYEWRLGLSVNNRAVKA